MQAPDTEVIEQVISWLRGGEQVILATVARTWGSSPRPVGSLMAIRGDGRFVGSVSGGCVEADLVERLRDGELDITRPTVCSYGLRRDEADRLGLPCGGRLELVVEAMTDLDACLRLTAAIGERRLTLREVHLDTGRAELHPAAVNVPFHYDGRTLGKVFGPPWRLLLIGAGQASRYLAEMAQTLDFDVVVCDPRREQSDTWTVGGVRIDGGMPDDAVLRWASDARSAVVTLTHDPRLDDMGLMEALLSDAFYIGALGSRITSRKRRGRLRQLGLPEEAIRRLRAPVGLAIGSRTPAEIAVSTLAEIIAVRNGAADTADAAPVRREVTAQP